MRRLFALSLAVFFAVSASAPAQIAFGVWTFPADPGGNARLVSFNVATPQVFNVIGSMGLSTSTNFVNGLEFDGAGNLFASGGLNTNFLFSVNQGTGATTLIGGSGLAAGQTITDLSWDPIGNRMLGIGVDGVGNPALYSINTGSGAATNIGPITGTTETVAVSLAVRNNGEIYMHGVATDRWYRVDPGTLVATPLNVLPFDTNFGQGGSFDRNTGIMYHAAFNSTAFLGQLYTIDPATGNPTLIGGLGDTTSAQPNQITDLAFAPIPEPTSFVLMGIAGSAMWVRRRSKKA